jgi:Lon protease-like protein
VTRKLPLFPLPGVVLFPDTLLPLHIFEPRYKEMVRDSLESDRTIGLAMLKEGRTSDEGASPIHAIGGAGEIMDSERLEDGRYNILVRGRFRYRILGEESPPNAAYRVAKVEPLESLPFATDEEAARVAELARSLFAVLQPEIELPPLPEGDLDPERLASELALRLRYEPAELQGLLETNSLPSRFTTLLARMIEWQKKVDFLSPYRPPDLDVTRN